MKRDTAETIVWIIGATALLLLLISLGFAVAMGVAWAITSIWPSVPFWPTAIGLFLLSALFKSSSSK